MTKDPGISSSSSASKCRVCLVVETSEGITSVTRACVTVEPDECRRQISNRHTHTPHLLISQVHLRFLFLVPLLRSKDRHTHKKDQKKAMKKEKQPKQQQPQNNKQTNECRDSASTLATHSLSVQMIAVIVNVRQKR